MASKRLDAMTQNIHDWATNEMNYQGSGTSMLNANDLKELCFGPMMDIFPFIVKHVKSKQTVQKIRGNVQLQPNVVGQNIDSNRTQTCNELVSNKIKTLNTKKHDLKSELEEKRRTLAVLRKAVDDRYTTCILKEERRNQLLKSLDDTNARMILLEAQSAKTRRQIADHRRFDVLLADIIERCDRQNYPKVTTYVEMECGIISACMKNVRDSCRTIEKLVLLRIGSNDIIDDQAWTADKTMFESVEETVLSNNESEIVECLVESATKSLEFDSDIVANDNLKQFSSKSRVQQIFLISTFVKTKESQIVIHETNTKRAETCKSIEAKLVKVYCNDDNSLNLSHRFIEATVEEAKLKGQIEYLKKERIRLNDKLSVLEEQCKSLDATYESIVLEEEKLKKKQAAVASLLSYIERTCALFDVQQREVKEMMTMSFQQSNLNEMFNHFQLLRNSTATDIQALSTLPLHLLISADFDGDTTKRTFDLDSSQRDAMHLNEITKLIKEDVHRKQRLVNVQTYLMDSVANCQRGFESDSITALSGSISKLRARKMESLLSEVRKCLKTTTEKALHTLATKKVVHTWWEQPAQNIDIGLTVDKKSLQDWIN